MDTLAEKPTKNSKEGSVSSLNEEFVGTGEVKLQRQLKNRHVAMISIGGVIGTGLFLGTASALRNGGPIGLLLGYCAVGSICYAVMISLGEMISYLPLPSGGHIRLAERFVNPAFSFAMGWNYWYNWTIILPAELSASAVLINYWNKDINNAVWITICMVVVFAINMCGAGVYGEAEFIFASIKVVTITGLIILSIVLDLGGGPNHDRLGFRYWKKPGPFVEYSGITGNTGKFLGWWAVMTQAAFSFIGTEIVAIAAGEAKNPRRNIPKAIRRVYIRILLFYVCGTLAIGLLVPSTEARLDLGSDAAGSPFVIAIQNAGIKSLPSVINAALLTSAWSAASSDLYTSSRALYGLAAAGNAPKIFLKTSKRGLPYVSIIFCSLFALLAFMGINDGSGKVFGWFANMTAVAGLMTWFGISVTYIRFYYGLKAQGMDRKKYMPFYTNLQPYAAYYGAVTTFIICLFSGWSVFLKGKWDTAKFVTNYLPFALFPIMYFGALWYYRKQPVAPEDMDFHSDIAEIEADEYDEPPPKNALEKFWAWLM